MKIFSSVLMGLALLAGGSSVSADPWHDHDRGHGRDDRHDRGNHYDDRGRHDGWRGRDRHDGWDHRYYSDRAYYGRPHRWERGYRYDGPMYIVDDYRGYRLAPPPYGTRWVRNDGSFLLVNIGDSMIVDMVIR